MATKTNGRRSILAGATGAALTVALGCAAIAHTGATGIVKERMDAMGDIGAGMKAISQMVRGERDYDTIAIAATARQIGELSDQLPDMFPEGSATGPSEALPEIWTDWDGFSSLTDDLRAAAADLASAADSGDRDAVLAAFAAAGRTCTTCHEIYRK